LASNSRHNSIPLGRSTNNSTAADANSDRRDRSHKSSVAVCPFALPYDSIYYTLPISFLYPTIMDVEENNETSVNLVSFAPKQKPKAEALTALLRLSWV
jgi:hypothetical protein